MRWPENIAVSCIPCSINLRAATALLFAVAASWQTVENHQIPESAPATMIDTPSAIRHFKILK